MIIETEGRGQERHSKGLNTFRRYLETLNSEHIERIIIDLQHGNPQETTSPPRKAMRIVVFSVPIDVLGQFYQGLLEVVELDGNILNLMDCQSDAFIYNSKTPLLDYELILDRKGQVLGIVKENILWIPFDLVHEDFGIEEITGYIMRDAFGLIGRELDPRVKEERERQMLETLYRQFVMREAETIDRDYEAQEKRVSELARNFASEIRKLTKLARDRELLKYDIEKRIAQVHEIISAIKNNPKVSRVRVANNFLVVDTNDIYLGPFNIGKYRILISNQGLPRLEKIDKKMKGDYLHPHALANGEICFGGFRDVVRNYNIARWDEVIVAILTILESYNSADRYGRLEDWLKANFPKQFDELYSKYVPPGHEIDKIVGGEVIVR